MGVVTPIERLVLELDPHARVFGAAGAARGTPRGWDFLGNLPVPLRARARDGIASVVARHAALGGESWRVCVPMGQGGRGPFHRLRFIRDLDAFPRVLVSAEYGNAFNRRFHERHVASGAFASGQPAGAAPVFEEAGLIDPLGRIGVFAVAPFVMLIDRRRLGDRPAPARWADLADPLYRGEVIFGGWRREGERHWSAVNDFFLASMLVMLGEAGLRRLLANVPSLLHSAQMPRLAATDVSPGAIYVLPWALADFCPRRADTTVVWPEDGALAYPLWMTVQSAHRDRLAPLVDHFFSAAVADWLDHDRYPSLAPGRAGAVPQGGRLAFLGWERLRHLGFAAEVKRARTLFLESRRDIGEDRSCG